MSEEKCFAKFGRSITNYYVKYRKTINSGAGKY